MIHSFDSEIAEKYGILEAVLLNNIYYWIEKNRANEQNFHDGTYWTYNSTKAFSALFPYASERQIKAALMKLREAEILLTGNYNENPYDRTLWYALSKKGLCIVQNRTMESTEPSNEKDETGQSLSNTNNIYISTDIKPDINQLNTSCSEPEKPATEPQEEAGELFLMDDETETNNAVKKKENDPSPVIELLLNDKSLFPVYQSDVDEWQELYPAVDVMQQLRNMKGWIMSNPARRKTKKGIRRFITSWLMREQDKGIKQNTKDVENKWKKWVQSENC